MCFENGVETERARILDIQNQAKELETGRNVNLSEMTEKLVADGINVSLAVEDLKTKTLDLLTDQAPASPGPNEETERESNRDTDEMDAHEFEKYLEKAWDKNAKVRKEFSNDRNAYMAFEKADKNGQIRGKI